MTSHDIISIVSKPIDTQPLPSNCVSKWNLTVFAALHLNETATKSTAEILHFKLNISIGKCLCGNVRRHFSSFTLKKLCNSFRCIFSPTQWREDTLWSWCFSPEICLDFRICARKDEIQMCVFFSFFCELLHLYKCRQLPVASVFFLQSVNIKPVVPLDSVMGCCLTLNVINLCPASQTCFSFIALLHVGFARRCFHTPASEIRRLSANDPFFSPPPFRARQ